MENKFIEVKLDLDSWIEEDDLKDKIIREAASQIISGIWGYQYIPLEDDIRKAANKLINDNKNKIIKSVIERVSETISHKRAVFDLTPKVSELAKIDKDNEKYFCELIDKAIAKKFR